MASTTDNSTRRPANPPGIDAARLLTTVDSESRPYTDPRAQYQRAEDYRRTALEGAVRRRPAA